MTSEATSLIDQRGQIITGPQVNIAGDILSIIFYHARSAGLRRHAGVDALRPHHLALCTV